MVNVWIFGTIVWLAVIVAFLLLILELSGSKELSLKNAIIGDICLAFVVFLIVQLGSVAIPDSQYYNAKTVSYYNNYSVVKSSDGDTIYKIGGKSYFDSPVNEDGKIGATINKSKGYGVKSKHRVTVEKQYMSKARKHEWKSSLNPVLMLAAKNDNSKITVTINE